MIIQDYWPTALELNLTGVPNEMFEKILIVNQLGKNKHAHLNKI